MPYLAFDLDAKKRVPKVAKALGMSPGDVSWGLLELWEHAWAGKTDLVSEMVIDGCFGPDARIRAALAEYGFIERAETGWRVKGADRYLRVTAARSKGGKAASGNLRQNQPSAGSQPVSPPAPDRLKPVASRSSAPALTPSTEHRAPNTSKEGEAPALGERLSDTFRQARGADYEPTFADEQSVRVLLTRAKGDEGEIVRRYGLGLARTTFPRVTTWKDLADRWNDCATPEKPPAFAPKSGRATEAEKDWTNAKPKLTPDGDIAL